MKLGALPIAADPDAPTEEEKAELASAISAYQAMFNTH